MTEMGCKLEFEQGANSVFVITAEPEGGTNVYEALAIDPCESGIKFDYEAADETYRVFVPWHNVERVSQQLMDETS